MTSERKTIVDTSATPRYSLASKTASDEINWCRKVRRGAVEQELKLTKPGKR